MMFVFYAVVAVIVAAWFFRKNVSTRRLPPGPRGIPVLGVGLQVNTVSALTLFPRWAKEFGPVFHFSIMGQHAIVINDAQLVRKAFDSKAFKRIFNDRPSTFVGEYVAFGSANVSFSKSIEDASRLRKHFFQGLHFYGEGVAKFENLVQEQLSVFVDKIEGSRTNDIDPRTLVDTFFFSALTSMLTGENNSKNIERNRSTLSDFIQVSNRLASPTSDSLLQALPWLRFIPGRLRNLYRKTTVTRDKLLEWYYYQQKRTYNGEERRGLVDYLLQLQEEQEENPSSKPISENNIKGILLDMISAGVQTSSNALLWTLLALLYHPDCITKIRRELDLHVGRERRPTFADKPSMPYTEAVVMETLRYVSLAPFLIPHLANNAVEFEGYEIPKGTQIFANTWFIHHDEAVWGDPWTYRPDRFLDEEGQLVSPSHPFRQAYLPFGVGKRQCVGESMAKSRIFLILTTLLQRFDIQPSTSLPPLDPRKHAVGDLITYAPVFTCRFSPRPR